MLKVYNSKTKQKEVFKTIQENIVNLYVCGITPYDYPHIGHGRSLIVYDMIYRYLEFIDYDVKFVRNITDIDDKLINKSKETNKSVKELAEYYYNDFNNCSLKLDCISPDIEPKVSDYTKEMIWFINQLLNKGYAYKTNLGNVYFDSQEYKKYYQDDILGSSNLEFIDDEYTDKKHNADFVLWKSKPKDDIGIETEFGYGRWGWHCECSTMSYFTLGHIDIHGGGLDLKFPHHECEIHQSTALFGDYAKYWVHNGLICLPNKNKISKSDKSTKLYLKDLITNYHKDIIKYWMLNSSYRSEIIYSEELLNQIKTIVAKIYLKLYQLNFSFETSYYVSNDLQIMSKFYEFMNNDFDTHSVLNLINDVLNSKNIDDSKLNSLKTIFIVLNIFKTTPIEYLQGIDFDDKHKIQTLVDIRTKHKHNKDYYNADLIKQELSKMNVELQDNKNTTFWYFK